MWRAQVCPAPDERPCVVHVLPETGAAGAERQALYLLGELRNRPWRVEVVYFRPGQLHSQFESLDVPLRKLVPRARLSVDWYRRGRALRSLYDSPPAILHTWLFEANVVGGVAARRWPATRLVVTQRSGIAEHRSRRMLYGGRFINRRADHAIANSRGGIALLDKYGFEPCARSLIENGIPASRLTGALAREQARASVGIPDGTLVVGFVGRADQTKDLPNLLRAMEIVWTRLPHARLVLAGVSVNELCALGLQSTDRISALGWLPDATRIMRAFDVLAHSAWTEGHSNAVGEALMLGLPVATTNTGDHAEIVSDSGGQVVPVRRPDLLAAAVLELLDNPPAAERVASLAAARLAMKNVVQLTEQLYREVLDRPRSAKMSVAASTSGPVASLDGGRRSVQDQKSGQKGSRATSDSPRH
jgi:glycosyltransferase involved in cell wall biosynthesis